MLQVSTTAAHQVNTLGTELGHGRLATHLELSLLDVDHHLSTSQTTLMTRITANTYTLVRTAPPSRNTERTYPLFKVYQYKRYNDRFLRTRMSDKKEASSDPWALIINRVTIPSFLLFLRSRSRKGDDNSLLSWCGNKRGQSHFINQ